jgi:DNA-binding MarR family transcriptional regulator
MLKDLPRFECLLRAADRYPTLDPAASEAFLNLLRTGDAVFEAESAFLGQHAISQGRFSVLMLLKRCEEQCSTPAELAEKVGVTRATMTGLLDTLEKDGIVSRGDDLHDRRTVLVRLTEAGSALLERMLPDYFACVSQIMEPLNPAERRQLVRLLQKIQQGLATAVAPQTASLAATAV